jgi:DNA polymerase-3 subunit delta'
LKYTALPWHAEEFNRLLAARENLPHALLFRGPPGIGKLLFARALMQALLCESPAAGGGACGECAACHWCGSDSHPDSRIVQPASLAAPVEDEESKDKKLSEQISVDQVRELSDFINVTSHRGGRKFILLHPAEALNASSANALLKNLEEPPPETYFLLVTHRPLQLLPTIKSRCQHIALAKPDHAAAVAWLEAQQVEQGALALAQAGDAPLLAVTLGTAEYWAQRAAFVRQITASPMNALAAAEALRDLPIPQIVGWLQKWSYDLASYHTLGKIKYNPDCKEAIAAASARVSALAAVRFHREMVRTQRIAHHPLNARLFLEHTLLGYAELLSPMRPRA